MAEPRIILWDLETTHNVLAAFRLLNMDMIPPENIISERYIVCASWKVLGSNTVQSVSTLDNPALFKKDSQNDKHVVEVLHGVLSGADVIVAHNGDQYDTKFAATRMLAHGLPPLPPIPSVDTLKVAKARFLFNSNKLDYLGHMLKVGRKRPTTSGLWLRVLQGDKEAIREMVDYNKQDVELLERVFMKLRPYIPDNLSRQLYGHPSAAACPRCGSKHIQSRGTHRSVTRTYTRFQCQDCMGWFRLVKANKPSSTLRLL